MSVNVMILKYFQSSLFVAANTIFSYLHTLGSLIDDPIKTETT